MVGRMTSVWMRQPRKGKEQLSREQIVAEAIKLLDESGIESLSMRNLGTRLNAGATSLYRHVANKDELIELVADEVYAEIHVPDGSWREATTATAYSVREMILRHPWIASVLGQVGLSYLGPNFMQLTESLLVTFEKAGFDLAEADMAISSVLSYVVGIAISEAAWYQALARSGQTAEEWADNLRPAVEQVVSGYPRLKELTAGHLAPGATAPDKFAYGLEKMLDALEKR
jgi:AcrR family transcriptional regulator